MSEGYIRRRPAAAAPIDEASGDGQAKPAAGSPTLSLLFGFPALSDLPVGDEVPPPPKGGTAPEVGANDGETPATVQSAIAKVAALRKEMDAIDKEIMEEIRRVEEVMRGHFNARTSVEMASEDEWYEFLAFGKHEGRWQLLIVTGMVGDEAPDTRPLLACGREKRAEVVAGGHIRTLVMRAAEQYAREMRDRLTGLKDLRKLRAELAAVGKAGE